MLTRLFSILICLILSSCEATPPADITDPGQLLFLGYAKKEVNCARCHGPQGEGGQDAPDIRQAFEKYSEADILFFIENGKGEGNNAMPALEGEMTDEELRHLLRFLRTLKPESSRSNRTPN